MPTVAAIARLFDARKAPIRALSRPKQRHRLASAIDPGYSRATASRSALFLLRQPLPDEGLEPRLFLRRLGGALDLEHTARNSSSVGLSPLSLFSSSLSSPLMLLPGLVVAGVRRRAAGRVRRPDEGLAGVKNVAHPGCQTV